jgi:ATP-dependent exoDNAse (exonuclease V) beta subunit
MPNAVAHLKIVFQSRGQVDFTEVSQAALMALGSSDEPTDLALALDYRIRHLLIDEFQDTSISQYELLSRLTAGWEEGDGRTLFVVGDPMQSIYRFREAEVGLFLRARESGIGNLSLRPISLSANFRSQGGIVDWVNQTFSEVMPENEDISSGAVSYTPSTATHKRLPGSAVHVHPFFDDDHSSEAERIVQIIRQLQSDEPESSAAILVRSRGHLREILIHLNEAGIRFRAIEIEGLGHRPVVQDLVSLTRAIIHPADRMAWLAVMRAPWCGLTIADLNLIAADQSDPKLFLPPPTLWELINDEDILSRISADGRSRLQRLRTVMGGCIANRYRSSLRSMVEGAWTVIGGPACVTDITDLADAKIYLDHLESNEENGSIPDLSLFESGLERLFALPDLGAPDRLQIMTIHKSKGLEFDHVIVPGLGRLSRSNEKKLFMWMEIPRSNDRRNLEGEGSDLLMAPIQETGSTGDPIYSWIEKLDADKSHFEDQRLIYVASTRARKRLHLLGSTPLGRDQDGVVLKAPPRKSLLSKIWPVSSRYYEESTSDPERVKKISSEELPIAPDPVEWSPPTETISSQNRIEYSWAGEAARHAGSVVHHWLERIAEDRLEGWNESRLDHLKDTFKQNLIECGVSGDDLEIAIGRVITSIKYSITDPRGRWLLGPQTEAQNELRLTGLIDGRRMDLVIDRTFLDEDGNRWIVDYKTSSHTGSDLEEFLDREQERYRDQMDRYSAIMRRTDRRPIMIGLYFPLIGGWREWGGDHGPGAG